MPALSVIVPVYNMEKYLDEFINSLIDQDFMDAEFLLIDDGSTDKSFNICQYYEKKDSRIKAYSKLNEGVASARQFGLNVATGDYITHADPDDLIAENGIKLMMDDLKKSNADICIGAYSVFYTNFKKNIKISKIKDSQEFIRKLAFDEIHGSLWNKIIRKSIAKEKKFIPHINYMEDKLYLLSILKSNSNLKITCIDSIVYYYRQRLGSYTNSLKSIENFEKSSELMISELRDVLSIDEINHIKNSVRFRTILLSDDKSIVTGKYWIQVFKDHNFRFHERILALFLSLNIKIPLIFYKKFLLKKRSKLGLYL